MSTKHDGGPAFPFAAEIDQHSGQYTRYGSDGLSLRDYFAAKAMQGIQTSVDVVREPDGSMAPNPLTDADIARLAYAMADAMLAERVK